MLVCFGTTEVRESGEPDATALSQALYGLGSLSDSAEARALLGELIPRVRRCEEEFTGVHIGTALSRRALAIAGTLQKEDSGNYNSCNILE